MLRANAAVLPLQCPHLRIRHSSFSLKPAAVSQASVMALFPSNRNYPNRRGKGEREFLGEMEVEYGGDEWEAGKAGLAAVLAYGLFDGVTYTTFFVLAFLGYEKSTGKNPAANLQALVGIVVLMWTGNNVTRPFRVAGAAALAPAIDKGRVVREGKKRLLLAESCIAKLKSRGFTQCDFTKDVTIWCI
ncbi:hypothetical protein Nepgr_000728 [Nepenthes gracilis]|uniref:Uncharacterized protein n=1 Tax=Nepenthes gracilis TaxID=150966 RepID=A0AAD3P3C5_NEPGR|nr:hypothetical protein Nepgr_000728 [Nepenthes gracilis]